MASAAVSDDQLTRVLGGYAGMVSRVLSNPGRWLGMDEEPPPSAPLPARALDALRDRALGDVTPASPGWSALPESKRVDWWVTRIGVSAGLAAAAPRVLGVLADRLPLQPALGAAAAGLAVCATAYEHGRTDPANWVPLLGRVLFDRDLAPVRSAVPDEGAAEQGLDPEADPPGTGAGWGPKRAARTLWQLARTFTELGDLFDERPRGNFLARGVAKLPVIGLAGGWLDERGGIRKAAKQTRQLLG